MPTPLIIDKQLSPGKEYTFRVTLNLGGETVVSRNITFKAPPATFLMSRLGSNFTYKILRESGEKVPSTKTWSADRFKKLRVGGSECIQLRLVNDDDGYQELSSGTKIKFQTQGSNFLSGLHNTEAPIVSRERNNENRVLVTIKITKARWDDINRPIDVGQDLSVPANNRISLTTTRVVKKNQVSVNVEKSVVDGLVKIGNVHDILVFSYRQYDGPLNSKAKRYYLREVPEKSDTYLVKANALSYSLANQLFINNKKQKYNFSDIRFDPKNGKKFIIYATVVRYIKVGSDWVPINREDQELPNGWLQLNEDNEPIWGRAVVAST
jgi:hypothetical protein